jgi:ATP-dependent protease ClpP protease subunit
MKSILRLVLISAALCACAMLNAKPMKERRVVHLNNVNTVILADHIGMVSVDTTVGALLGKRVMLPADETLYIVIASGGGEIDAALALHNFIGQLPNTVLICKYCASAASMIFADASHPRLVTNKSVVLMHEMYMPHVTAKMAQDSSFVDAITAASDAFNEMIYKHIGITKEQYEDKILNTEWVVEGGDAVGLHLADELVRVECDTFESMLLPDTCSE